MSGTTRAVVVAVLAGGSGAEQYIADVEANGSLSKVSSSFSASASPVDDCDDRVQCAGGCVSFFGGFLYVSSKKVGIGTDRATVLQLFGELKTAVLHQLS